MDIVLDCLNTFCMFSEAKVSIEKTRLYCSKNINHIVKQDISTKFGFTLIGDLGKYHHKRVNRTTYNFVVDKVNKRLSSWKVKKLSLAGRATLLQSVLNTIPLYYMQSTLLPSRVCLDIDKMSRNFVWGSSPMGHKIHLVAWDGVCKKKDYGGLGFRHARGMN